MVWTYIKKTDRGKVHEDVFRQAADELTSNQNSLRKAAEKYDINLMTLQCYIKKNQNQTWVKTVHFLVMQNQDKYFLMN